jgi:hypothetical protein
MFRWGFMTMTMGGQGEFWNDIFQGVKLGNLREAIRVFLRIINIF